MTNESNPRPFAPIQEATDAGMLHAFVSSMLNAVHVATMVKVVSSTNSSGVSPVGYVDIQPLIGQLDNEGKVIDHNVIYNARYLRVQGGSNAVIIDPQAGDVGLAIFCERDIGATKTAGEKSQPISLRKFSLADAVYCFSMVTSTPSQYVRIHGGGIEIKSPNKITLTAPNVEINGFVQTNGSTSTTGSAVTNGSLEINGPSLKHNGKNVGSSHVHTGVMSGGSNTGAPA